MPTVGEIDKVLSLAAPKELSESWDNDGVMFCSHANATVNKVLAALDATDAAVSFAADNGFDCIVTHHPFIFSPLSRINSDVYGIFKTLWTQEYPFFLIIQEWTVRSEALMTALRKF